MHTYAKLEEHPDESSVHIYMAGFGVLIKKEYLAQYIYIFRQIFFFDKNPENPFYSSKKL
jgi:hypothetical protein